MYPLIFNRLLRLIQDFLHILDCHDLSRGSEEKQSYTRETEREPFFCVQRFIYFFGWLVNFQTPALDLSGSHAAVVKALLLNPLIFKQCATAMLTQTTNWLCCFSGSYRFTRLKKYAYQGTFLHLITALTDAEGKGGLSQK